jgi:hypothetical protein
MDTGVYPCGWSCGAGVGFVWRSWHDIQGMYTKLQELVEVLKMRGLILVHGKIWRRNNPGTYSIRFRAVVSLFMP